MIISHKHRFIFIKTKKTAGTSIEIALSKICGEEDIITPIVPEDESIRTALGYRGPQNYIFHGVERFYNHCPARVVRALVGDEVWATYFKFCLYENIGRELERIEYELDLPELPPLPRAKSRFRQDNRHWRKMFSTEDKVAVAKLFYREIAHFGFTF